MQNIESTKENNEKIKTTVLLNKTLKKLAQVYAVQNDITLGELIEQALKSRLMPK
jgi:hypothetical protein